mmetsp:Transcript_12705/g.19040  ORF Transcript_12705/g.19040 Transcript_12705/m.19040 type:complete len:140 (-) Transcript_12705:306-725(-)
MKLSTCIILLPTAVNAFAPNAQAGRATTTILRGAASSDSDIVSRRSVMATIFLSTLAASNANALDMDAFMNNELSNDLKNCDPKRDPKCIPKLTEEEALCKYGQGGKARAAACTKLKSEGKALPNAAPQGKSMGGAYAM